MQKYVVVLDTNLTEKEISRLTEAIKQFSGVVDIYSLDAFDEDPQIKAEPPPLSEEDPQMKADPPPLNEDNVTKNSRHAINYAVKWALKHGKLTTDQMKQMQPEELVNFALKIIAELPNEDKKELGQQLNG